MSGETPVAARAASGFLTLLYKELLRVWKISFQTVAAPMLTALLYLVVFAYALEGRVRVFDSVSYTTFLVPGLAMMTMLQNAFANSSSSFIQSKVTGNLVFILLPPISHWEFFGAYVGAAMIRGVVVGLGVLVATGPLVGLPLAHPQWSLAFAVLGTGVLGTLGLVAGIWADYVEISKSPWIRNFDGASQARYKDEDWKVKKDGGQFDFMAGATISPRAVVKAVHHALQYFALHHDELLAATPVPSQGGKP